MGIDFLNHFLGKIETSKTKIFPYLFLAEIQAFAINQSDLPFKDCAALTEIKLPEGLTTIAGNYAISNNPLLGSIVIPASVTSIGAWTFSGDGKLQAIYFKGTALPANLADKWNSLVNQGSKEKDPAPYYLYSETTPASNPTNYWHYVDGVPTVYAAA